MNRPRAIVWDVGGTFAETERDGRRVAFDEASAPHGLPPSLWRGAGDDRITLDDRAGWRARRRKPEGGGTLPPAPPQDR